MRREEEAGISAIAAELTDVKCVYWDSPVDIGDVCRVAVEFKYQGPATTKRIYAAIGNVRGWVFDEILSAYKDLNIPYFGYLGTIVTFVNIPITSAIDPAGSPYDLYAKVDGLFPKTSPFYKDVIVISGVIPPPDYRNLEIVSYSPAELIYGDTLRMTFKVEHIGEAQTGTLYAAIGEKDTWFNERLKKSVSVSFLESADWEEKTINVNIPITEAIDTGRYEFYAKLIGVTGPDLYVYSPQDVLSIVGGYKGKIIKKTLEVSDIGMLDIPVAREIPLNSNAKVHVYTRNIGVSKYHPNCQWQVKDSNGDLLSSYNNTAIDIASPGEETHFFEAIETFTLTDTGDYTIEIWLSAFEDGSLLDHWQGKLCTVKEVEELEDGRIVAKKLEVSGVSPNPDIPVSQEIAKDSRAKVHVYVRNTGEIDYHPRCRWEVRDPEGDLVKLYEHTSTEWASPGEEIHFFEAIETFTFRDIGNYTVKIEVFSGETGKLLDDWEGSLCTVAEEVPPPPPCVPGETKCIGPDLYECSPDSEWVLIEENAPECVLPPEKKFPWVAAALIGGGAAVAIAAAAKKPKKLGA